MYAPINEEQNVQRACSVRLACTCGSNRRTEVAAVDERRKEARGEEKRCNERDTMCHWSHDALESTINLRADARRCPPPSAALDDE